MARQSEDTRRSRYVISIVCEGQNTEPAFFYSLRDKIIEGKYNIGDIGIIVYPKIRLPSEDANDEPSGNNNRGKYRGKKRKTKVSNEQYEDGDVILGVPPLKWVLFARKTLKEGCDEAWAVFDKDGHPATKEAFEEASKEIDGKIVNIAFSSRSFEYFLLLHFEDIYWEFEATECGERINGHKKPFDCMGDNPKEKACKGDKCINGYARKKGHWKKSKTTGSMLPLVENKFVNAIITANLFRFISDIIDPRPIYERNPYTTMDKLICRLTNIHVIDNNNKCELLYSRDRLCMQMSPSNIYSIQNISNRSVVINKEALYIYCNQSKVYYILDKNIMLPPGEIYTLICPLTNKEALIFNDKEGMIQYIFLPKYEVYQTEGIELTKLLSKL